MYKKIAQFAFATGFGTLSVIGISFLQGEGEVKASKRSSSIERPNIVMLIADDMGYSDLASYGGEIETPNIDALIGEGMMLTNFHTAPTCSPTRSMLLTGVDNHDAGVGNMLEKLAPNQIGQPNYEGYLNDKVVTLPTLLRDSGYHTYMAGKWHLGGVETPEKVKAVTGEEISGFDPYERGFSESFTLLEGAGDHYSMRGFSPYFPVNDYTLNGEKLTELPEDFYSTKDFTDKMIEYVESNRKDGKPFFSYLAYSAPHTPYQAPKEYIDKYVPIYEAGWDEIRAQRFTRMKELGLIPKYLELPARWTVQGMKSWDSLSPEEQKYSAKKMATYAAMIDYLDMSIGRYIDYLKEVGEYENTIFIFMTDNGADGHDRQNWDDFIPWIEEEGMDNSYENMGLPNSYITRDSNWSQVSATPHWSEKSTHAQGGLAGSFAISYPGFIQVGRTGAFSSVKDVTPTLLEYAGVEHPGSLYKGREIHPMAGKSMRPVLEGFAEKIYADDEAIAFEIFGKGEAAVYMGDWKLVRLNPGWGDKTWKLYNLALDPTETKDLSEIYPDLRDSMIKDYEVYAEEKQIIPDNRVN
ncbi:arylsulfatase A family protein [Xenococcus sp. PCC 7305]|uniref:arylsulfatase n=1 Tax=Xenococcus sp. PCC 7305 TaxID=102125 RepID=UPI0002ACB411|nr:arylsulfatase [Xenococcus sp. PCC 7305]ELS03514.1 arylsulfatase A family protein [Xenococcus sp. PCC 7305]